MIAIWKQQPLFNVLLMVVFVLVLWMYQPSYFSDNSRNEGVNGAGTGNYPLTWQPGQKPRIDPSLPEWKQELLQNHAFAIISSKKFHPRLQWLLKSWWTRDIDSIVTVLSDTTESTINLGEETLQIPNVVNTSCPNTYNYGLWCKNLYMLREWRDNPKYKHVRWFYRGMDDSWVHLENFVWLTKQFDYREPIVIGETVCKPDPYPDGGPGFIISRGVIDHPLVVESWEAALKKNGRGTIFDDVIWGMYMSINNVTLVHYNGITHGTLHGDSEVYQYILKQKNQKWPLSFRPVCYHQQGGHIEFMPEISKQLLQINYGRLSNNMYTPPDCKCHTPRHRRCWYPGSPDEMCLWSSRWLHCIGPGPWPQLDGMTYKTPQPKTPH